MKRRIIAVVGLLLVICILSGCGLIPSSETTTTTTTDPQPPSKNNLTGTFGRPYASYYEEGEALLDEDTYVVYMNFDGFARYYFDAYLADENLSKDSTLKKLMSEGTFFENLRNALPSITNPCQNQVLSGATSAVTKNVYRYHSSQIPICRAEWAFNVV